MKPPAHPGGVKEFLLSGASFVPGPGSTPFPHVPSSECPHSPRGYGGSPILQMVTLRVRGRVYGSDVNPGLGCLQHC